MAQATIIFKDTEKGTKIGLDIKDVEKEKEMTNALFHASLVSYILENQYHLQFKEEFIQQYEDNQE